MIALVFRIDHLIRLEAAPEPDALGKQILRTHWNRIHGMMIEHDLEATQAAAAVPIDMFSDGDASLKALTTFCARMYDDVYRLEPLGFEKLRALDTQIQDFASGVLTLLVQTAVNNDLSECLSAADTAWTRLVQIMPEGSQAS